MLKQRNFYKHFLKHDFKLVKDPTTSVDKKVAVQLYKDVNAVKRSCQAIARVVHQKSYRRWTNSDELYILSEFKKQRRAYIASSNKDEILSLIALGVKRSPCAVRARLSKLGAF